MSLLLSGYSYDAYLFIPFILMIQFIVIEIVPFVFVLDYSFLDKVMDKTSQHLTERLYEPQLGASRLDISQDPSSYTPFSGDRQLY